MPYLNADDPAEALRNSRKLVEELSTQLAAMTAAKEKAEAACAEMHDGLETAFAEGRRTAPTDLDPALDAWERSDTARLFTSPNPGQPILDELAKLRTDAARKTK